MTPAELEALAALESAATPGPVACGPGAVTFFDDDATFAVALYNAAPMLLESLRCAQTTEKLAALQHRTLELLDERLTALAAERDALRAEQSERSAELRAMVDAYRETRAERDRLRLALESLRTPVEAWIDAGQGEWSDLNVIVAERRADDLEAAWLVAKRALGEEAGR